MDSCCPVCRSKQTRSSGDRGMNMTVLVLTMVSTTLDAVMSTSRAPKVTATAAGLSSVFSQAAASLSVVWDRVSCSLAFTSSEAARTATRRAGRGATAAASRETPSQRVRYRQLHTRSAAVAAFSKSTWPICARSRKPSCVHELCVCRQGKNHQLPVTLTGRPCDSHAAGGPT